MDDARHKESVELKRPNHFLAFILWPALFVVVYLLATGPIVMIGNKLTDTDMRRKLDSVFNVVFAPVGWLYVNTPLRKPLGIYWHLWDPQHFDKDGNLRFFIG